MLWVIMLEGKLWSTLGSCTLRNRFSLRISLFFAQFSFLSTLTSLPDPAAKSTPMPLRYHHHKSPCAGCWAADEQCPIFFRHSIYNLDQRLTLSHRTRESSQSPSSGLSSVLLWKALPATLLQTSDQESPAVLVVLNPSLIFHTRSLKNNQRNHWLTSGEPSVYLFKLFQ